MLRCVIIVCLMFFNAHAEVLMQTEAGSGDETTVLGIADTPSGAKKEFMIEQPLNAPNPLGYPVVDYQTPPPEAVPASHNNLRKSPQAINQFSPQNPSDSEMPPQEMNNEIQNKIYESGDRVYDLQSYPKKDFDYIGKINQDNAVTDYPAY
ncbi:MAG: hypothetical protein IJ689_01525 [Alphaproteobacteria bacterium]|nr:hypothetical protein [Alphaproteobacteria bacterium]